MTNYLFFDTETTGLWNYKQILNHTSQPHIVQLAATLIEEINQEKYVRGQINFLVRPTLFDHIPQQAIDAHGLELPELEQYGFDIKIALKAFTALAQRADVFVAHNLSYDKNLIEGDSLISNLPTPFGLPEICTMKSSTNFCKLPSKYGKYKWPRLDELHQILFSNGFSGAHDAMIDVDATVRCFFELRARGIIQS